MLLYMRILILVDRTEFMELLQDVDNSSLLTKCELKVLVLVSEQVRAKDELLYILILRKLVLNSLGKSQSKDHFNILSRILELTSSCFLLRNYPVHWPNFLRNWRTPAEFRLYKTAFAFV